MTSHSNHQSAENLSKTVSDLLQFLIDSEEQVPRHPLVAQLNMRPGEIHFYTRKQISEINLMHSIVSSNTLVQRAIEVAINENPDIRKMSENLHKK